MESNDSPEIPDRGETSDIPGLPSGGPATENVIDREYSLGMVHSAVVAGQSGFTRCLSEA